MKLCRRCGQFLSLNSFYNNRTRPDGKQAYCKTCWNAMSKERRQLPAVRAARRASDRAWRTANPERAAEKQRRYRQAHPELHVARFAAWYATVKDDPERRQRATAKSRAWAKANPDRRRSHDIKREAAKKSNGRTETVNRRAIYERDEYMCWLCREPTEPDGAYRRRPSLDHVVELADGGEHTTANIRTAHRSCNSAKGARRRWARVREQQTA